MGILEPSVQVYIQRTKPNLKPLDCDGINDRLHSTVQKTTTLPYQLVQQYQFLYNSCSSE